MKVLDLGECGEPRLVLVRERYRSDKHTPERLADFVRRVFSHGVEVHTLSVDPEHVVLKFYPLCVERGATVSDQEQYGLDLVLRSLREAGLL